MLQQRANLGRWNKGLWGNRQKKPVHCPTVLLNSFHIFIGQTPPRQTRAHLFQSQLTLIIKASLFEAQVKEM